MLNNSISKTRIVKVILVTVIIVALCVTPFVNAESEVPENTYTGIQNTSVILNNMNFSDVKQSNTWAKDAIYEISALELMKGYGSRNFGRTNILTKEQAIAIAYRAVGREAEAQIAAEALDNARQVENKKNNALRMWSDGYLQLAANDGLISAQDLADALTDDPASLTQTSFYRNSAAQRQDMAYYLAKLLKLNPVYGQQKIFNSYRDWESADAIKIPYIEAVLQKSIMNGDTNGRFNPKGLVTREQAAQIVKNAEELILPLLSLQKKSGTIESIKLSGDYTQGKNISKKVLDIRDTNGKLQQMVVEFYSEAGGKNRNEQNGSSINGEDRDLITYKQGVISKSNSLTGGDRIEYIIAPDKSVRFVRVISSTYDTEYIAVEINQLDAGLSTIKASKFFDLDYPQLNFNDGKDLFTNTESQVDVVYPLSGNPLVTNDGRKVELTSVVPGSFAVLTVKNDIVTEIRVIDLSNNYDESAQENGVTNGIVEDNNPSLGYLTLYNKDGTGFNTIGTNRQVKLRTYNYLNPKNIKVYKNHKNANIEAIEPGDSVFLKFDDQSNVVAISAMDNYTVKYGKVISKRAATLAIQYDNGVQQVLDVDGDISVIKGKKPSDYKSLKDGDRVKLLIHENSRFTRLKQISIENDEHLISNIYKGLVTYIDPISDKLLVQRLEKLLGGRWEKTEQKGFHGLQLSEENNIYANNQRIDENRVNQHFKNNEAYIAVEKDYGGDEKVVFISFRNFRDTETPVYDDSIVSAVPGVGEFNLRNENTSIKYDLGTMIIKDGRLVTGSSISNDDMAYVVANRNFGSGTYNAGIVQINERSDFNFVQIYRGRIAGIKDNRDFTVESYSQLIGLNWEYYNTQKTFKLTYDTEIRDDSGIVGQRDFIGYGEKNFLDRSVYIVADGVNARVINTVPYGIYNAKGEIYDVSRGSEGAGALETQPTGFKIRNARVYDFTTHMWNDSKDMVLSITDSSIVLKNNKIAKPADLTKGDKVRVIKKDDKETGEAYIILVGES